MENLHVVVWWSKRASLGDISWAVLKDVVSRNSIARLVAVQVGRDRKANVGEAGLLYKDLGTHAGVDSRGWTVLEAGAVDVSSTESDGWQAGVDVGEVVVVVGDLEVASVFGAVAVRVSNKRSFPLLNELAATYYIMKELRTWSWNLVHETVTSSLAWVISKRPS